MREELDLRYTFGEMTDAELLAFEDSLTGSARSEAMQMRTTLSDLKRMNDSIPEPQISFERVRHAIEAAPAAKAAPIWQRWLVLAAPLSALAVMAILMNRGGGPAVVAESVTESTSPSIASTVPEAAPEISPKPADWEKINQPVVIVATPARVSSSQTRPTRRYFARLDDGFRRSSTRLIKSAVPTVSKVPAEMRSGFGGDTASEAAGGTTMAAPAAMSTSVQESVVVVTSTPDSVTGANSAVEVSKQSDVVLGG